MSRMAEVPGAPGVLGEPEPGDARSAARSAVAWCVALLAGSALLGLLGGVIWSEVAPRALLQEVGTGTAQIVDAETRAFFGADVWYCAIACLAGLLTGVAGYRFAVARRTGRARAAVAAALILGGIAGELTMLWLGGQIGLSTYDHALASSPSGTLFSSTLALGSKSGLACWPLFTAVVLLIAEWGASRGAEEEATTEEAAAQEPRPGGPAPWAPAQEGGAGQEGQAGQGPWAPGPEGPGPGEARPR